MPVNESAVLREQLIETLRQRGALHDEAVAAAFRAVPRERFLPGLPLEQVYRDDAIATKRIEGVAVSSSSQPAIMAVMLEQLDVRPGMQVLEIGAGTGYNAALLQHLVGERGRVVTVDIDPEVAGWARERLDAAGYREVAVICADGADGYPGVAPYDRIEVTVGVADIAPAWVEQLAPGGVLVAPLWLNTAQISLALRESDGRLRSRSLAPCGFMRIRGRLAGADQFVGLGPGLTAATGRAAPSLARLRDLLSRPPRRERWEEVGTDTFSFAFYAALWSDRAVGIGAEPWTEAGFVGQRFGYVDEAEPSLCLLPLTFPGDGGEDTALVYGGDVARDRLRAALARWHALGRPTLQELVVTVSPLAAAAPPAPGEVAFDTRWWRLTFSRDAGPAI
ncbi:MAG TPA: methyltransferase domain-containing protein [Thermomicrobiaceae bacterium]|nr:methyltransferase domain-containing protein [Thermomicrobiaceae bacterium]